MSPQLSGHLANRITPLVIARAASDAGGRISTDGESWRAAVTAARWRSDLRGPLLSVALILARNADSRMLAAPGIENLERVCGLGRRRVYRVLKKLRESGFLGWVSTGSTSLQSGTAHWRATYVLTCPPGIELPPSPDDPEDVSPRKGSPLQEDPRAREQHWSDSPALRWVRRRYAAGWTDRQFWTALTYPVDMAKPYGPPTGKSLWRVLAWRVAKRSDGGRFVGPEALGVVPGSWVPPARDRGADKREWLREMTKPGAQEALENAIAECMRIAATLRGPRSAGRVGLVA